MMDMHWYILELSFDSHPNEFWVKELAQMSQGLSRREESWAGTTLNSQHPYTIAVRSRNGFTDTHSTREASPTGERLPGPLLMGSKPVNMSQPAVRPHSPPSPAAHPRDYIN